MRPTDLRLWTAVVALGAATVGVASLPWAATPASASNGTFHVAKILLGASLHHSYSVNGTAQTATETLSDPDDISRWGNVLFVGFQNGVQPQGQASSDGNLDSTVVELTLSGHVLGQWDVTGKADGVTVDPGLGVLATVNEDANSSLYLIRPFAPPSDAVTHFAYNEPLPHGGGTDALSIYRGQILISASAPGTNGTTVPSASDPAVYSVTLDQSTKIATVTPLFFDESAASVANVGGTYGTSATLMLTDPDSNEVVPFWSPRFGGDFMLTSQGDEVQIYVGDAGTSHQTLQELNLTQSVDDTAWPTDSNGSLYTTDSMNDAVDVVTGPFNRNAPMVVVTPCGANSAPPTCNSPNYLAVLDEMTGNITPVVVAGATYQPQGGLAFVDGHGSSGKGHGSRRH